MTFEIEPILEDLMVKYDAHFPPDRPQDRWARPHASARWLYRVDARDALIALAEAGYTVALDEDVNAKLRFP